MEISLQKKVEQAKQKKKKLKKVKVISRENI